MTEFGIRNSEYSEYGILRNKYGIRNTDDFVLRLDAVDDTVRQAKR